MKFSFKCFLLVYLFCLAVSSLNAEQQTTKIGIISPLSGKAAFIGAAIQNGISLAKEDHPELLSSFEFKFEDSVFENQPAVSAFNKLRLDPKIRLIYVFGHGQSHVLAPLAESAKMPLVACSGEAKISENRSYTIRFFPPHEWLGDKILQHLRSRGFKHFGMIKSEISFIENIYNGVKTQLAAGETLEMVDEYPAEATDFRSTIVKLKKKNFDALGVFLNQGQISPFYRQVKELSYIIPTFATHAVESEAEVKSAGPAIEGVVYPAVTAEDEFIRRYVEKFNNDNYVSFASNAYDFSVMIAKSIQNLHGDYNGIEILKNLKSISNYSGVSGEIKYMTSKLFGDGFVFPVKIKAVKNQKIITLH